jgi:hypothetical protein
LHESGWYIIIYSCRNNPSLYQNQRDLERGLTSMVEYLIFYGIQFDEVDDGSNGKPIADIYIDDRALPFKDNWGQIYSIVQEIGHDRTN